MATNVSTSLTPAQRRRAVLDKKGVGTSRRLSSITADTLREDLQSVLKPACVFRAREAASWMTSPRQSVLVTADLIEARAAQRA